MPIYNFLFLLLSSLICFISNSNSTEKSCKASDQCKVEFSEPRFFAYDVNHHEGFNLRRDVYMRLAIFFHHLKQNGIHWNLILPPWHNLPHWRSAEAGSQARLPWGLFFDLPSLQSFAPVLEMFEFLEDNPNVTVDNFIVLQHYQDLWKDNFTWTEKWDVEECLLPINFVKGVDGLFRGIFSGYEISAKKVFCVSFQGSASLLKHVIEAFPGRFTVFHRAETIIHDFYGGSDYWKCRASMKFSKELISMAESFIHEFILPSTKRDEKKKTAHFNGDPYLCVHLRRRDYLYSHPTHIPSIPSATKQLKEKLEDWKLDVVFLATDASNEEKREFVKNLMPFKVVQYIPSSEALLKYKDGGIAIIEQIVCAQARHFIGTYESTFSFRIQEERELLNFHPDSTFNRLCGDNELNCKQPTRWRKTV